MEFPSSAREPIAKRKRKRRIRKQRITESTVLRKLTKEATITKDRWVSLTQ